MNTRMYRQAALDRLSSPEDLDRTLTVTDARQWLALAGLLLFVLTAMVWAVLSRVPTKADGEGMLIGQGGVVNVVTSGSGVVTDFKLKIGDKVKAGQVVATIAQPDIVNSIVQTKNRMAESSADADRTVQDAEQSMRLQVSALEGQRANVQSDIQRNEKLMALAQEQVPVEQSLLKQGLATQQQVIAAQQKVVQLQSEIEKSKSQLTALDAQKFRLMTEPEEKRREANDRMQELNRQAQTLTQQMDEVATVVSPFSGEVVELKVDEGATVGTGTPVLSLQPEVGQLEVVAFVPTAEAKSIVAGMEAQVSPSTVKRAEYGYIRGRVSYVSDFPTTNAAAMRTFGNESLVDALKSQGVANEVRIVLQLNPSGGYSWSSNKTPPEMVNSGTLCEVQVVTKERRPVELVMPFVKGFFGAD